MDTISFTRTEAAEDAVGSIFTHDGARSLIDFIPFALEDAFVEAIRGREAAAALPIFGARRVRAVQDEKQGEPRLVRLKACIVAGPLGPVGVAVKTVGLDDDDRLDAWLRDWRSAGDVYRPSLGPESTPAQ